MERGFARCFLRVVILLVAAGCSLFPGSGPAQNSKISKQIATSSWLSEALGNTAIVFRSPGDAKWYPAADGGLTFARSGDISDLQQSELTVQIQGPAGIQFDWKVSSEPLYDKLIFDVDGKEKSSIDGSVDWTRYYYAVPKGIHTLRWVFKKDPTGSVGMDAGFVSDVKFAQGEWTSDNLARRLDCAMAYDSLRDRMILFGGYSGSPHGDTWASSDATNWTQITVAGPGARWTTAMVYDSVRDRVVIFGGRSQFESLGDTWEFDGAKWKERKTAVSPPARSLHSLTYDPINGITYLFGGNNGSRSFNDLWAWDGNTWNELSPDGTDESLPVRRYDASLAYDYVRGDLILIGGRASQNAPEEGEKTWIWREGAWNLIATEGPPPRRGALMLFDPISQKSLLLGGEALTGIPAFMWEWDGTKWLTNNSFYTFDAASNYAAAFDTMRQRVVTHYRGDTWVYENGGWARNSRQNSELNFGLISSAYDSDRDRIVGYVSKPQPEIFEYYDRYWHYVRTLPNSLPQALTVMDYDPVNKRFMIVYSSTKQFYYDPATGVLTDISTTTPFAFDIVDVSLSYDPVLHGMVLSMATTLQYDYIGHTTHWTGTGWAPQKDALIGSNVVFDTLCQKTIAVGRGKLLKYDASGWQTSTVDMRVSQSVALGLAHDPASGSDIIMGGQSAFESPYNGQFYLWVRTCDGTQLPVYPSGPVNFVRGEALIEATTQRAMVTTGDLTPDVWRWEMLPQPASPEMVTEILFGQIAPRSSIDSDANDDGIVDAADLIMAE